MTTTSERTRPTILVVEDRAEVLEVVSRTLTESGYDVLTAQDGETGLATAIDRAPDLLILDIGLPKVNGLDVARELRERGFRAPMLMLTARVTVGDRVAGLDAGADDYLVKPFDVDELVARVRALLRRATLRDEELILRVGTLQLDTVSREVSRDDTTISLTPKPCNRSTVAVGDVSPHSIRSSSKVGNAISLKRQNRSNVARAWSMSSPQPRGR